MNFKPKKRTGRLSQNLVRVCLGKNGQYKVTIPKNQALRINLKNRDILRVDIEKDLFEYKLVLRRHEELKEE